MAQAGVHPSVSKVRDLLVRSCNRLKIWSVGKVGPGFRRESEIEHLPISSSIPISSHALSARPAADSADGAGFQPAAGCALRTDRGLAPVAAGAAGRHRDRLATFAVPTSSPPDPPRPRPASSALGCRCGRRRPLVTRKSATRFCSCTGHRSSALYWSVTSDTYNKLTVSETRSWRNPAPSSDRKQLAGRET